MKKYILKSLHFQNYKQFADLEVEFGEKETVISGDNGTGKSSIYDGFMWLLTGKDVLDRKDYEIKRLVNGVSIPKVEVSVAGILMSDSGEEIKLKRQFVERWGSDKGDAEEKFKGNKTITTFNDIPMNVSEYENRIKELIDPAIFKMITNPLFFANMPWEQQREQLFQIAGCLTDDQIAERNDSYRKLLDRISGKSLRDYRREIVSKINKAKEALKETQPRIDQEYKMMPEEVDFDLIESEIEVKKQRLADIENAMYSKSEAANLKYKEIQKKQSSLNVLRSDRQQIVFKANMDERERINKSNMEFKNTELMIQRLEMEKKSITDQIEKYRKSIEAYQNYIKEDETTSEKLRQQWYDENEIEYSGDVDCHYCGQHLPDHMIDNARKIFQDSKANKLNSITTKGIGIGENIAESKKRIEEIKILIIQEQKKLDNCNDELKYRNQELEKKAYVKPEEVDPNTIPEYVEISQKIKALEDEIKNFNPELVDDSELKSQKAEINAEIDVLKAKLHNRTIINDKKAEIKRLETEAKIISQNIADLQKIEITINEFTKVKINDMESRINGLFSFVTFRLFTYTIEDNTENETCIPLVDGVPFPAANTAGQLNAGLDIINALSRHYGVIAPIFLDNRESVNEIIDTDAQIINLKVSQDKLTIKKK